MRLEKTEEKTKFNIHHIFFPLYKSYRMLTRHIEGLIFIESSTLNLVEKKKKGGN